MSGFVPARAVYRRFLVVRDHELQHLYRRRIRRLRRRRRGGGSRRRTSLSIAEKADTCETAGRGRRTVSSYEGVSEQRSFERELVSPSHRAYKVRLTGPQRASKRVSATRLPALVRFDQQHTALPAVAVPKSRFRAIKEADRINVVRTRLIHPTCGFPANGYTVYDNHCARSRPLLGDDPQTPI